MVINMENKNPIEEIRNAVLESKILGIDNEISRMGVSNELLKISDALDVYYGIERTPNESSSNEGFVLNNYKIEPNPYFSNLISSIVDDPLRDIKNSKYDKITNLLSDVKAPLKSMKVKLSTNDSVYLNLSSAIVSIALREVVSSVNSYQKPSYYDYKRYDPISGVDYVFHNLVFGGLKVFNELSDFDMTKECLNNYETNRKTLLSIAESIHQSMLHPRRTSSTTNSRNSGCAVLALAISASVAVCLCGLVITFF